MNLALYILENMAIHMRQGRPVSLASYRKANSIPPATFHRAINQLMDMSMVDRVGRDKYVINAHFMHLVTMTYRQNSEAA